MLPSPFVDLIDDPVCQTSVCRFRRHSHGQRDAAQAGGRDKVQPGHPPGHGMDFTLKISVGPCFCQIQRFRGTSVGHFILSDDLRFVDMSQCNVRKWG